MTKPGQIVLLLVIVAVAALSACEKRQAADDRGPAEKAGQQIDQAAARAGEELNELAGKVGQGMEKAGQKLQGEAHQARNSEASKKQ